MIGHRVERCPQLRDEGRTRSARLTVERMLQNNLRISRHVEPFKSPIRQVHYCPPVALSKGNVKLVEAPGQVLPPLEEIRWEAQADSVI